MKSSWDVHPSLHGLTRFEHQDGHIDGHLILIERLSVIYGRIDTAKVGDNNDALIGLTKSDTLCGDDVVSGREEGKQFGRMDRNHIDHFLSKRIPIGMEYLDIDPRRGNQAQ